MGLLRGLTLPEHGKPDTPHTTVTCMHHHPPTTYQGHPPRAGEFIMISNGAMTTKYTSCTPNVPHMWQAWAR